MHRLPRSAWEVQRALERSVAPMMDSRIKFRKQHGNPFVTERNHSRFSCCKGHGMNTSGTITSGTAYSPIGTALPAGTPAPTKTTESCQLRRKQAQLRWEQRIYKSLYY
jgi:hypothetical protein